MRKAAVIFAAAVTAAAGCAGERGTTPTLQRAVADSADQIIFGMEHFMVHAGIRQAQLFADTAYVFDNTTRFELQGVRLLTFDSIGAQSATLTSKEATYSTQTRSMEARGDVVVTTQDAKRLETPRLVFDQQTNRVRASSFTMVEPSRSVQGDSMVSDPNLSKLTCYGCRAVGATPPPGADDGRRAGRESMGQTEHAPRWRE